MGEKLLNTFEVDINFKLISASTERVAEQSLRRILKNKDSKLKDRAHKGQGKEEGLLWLKR